MFLPPLTKILAARLLGQLKILTHATPMILGPIGPAKGLFDKFDYARI